MRVLPLLVTVLQLASTAAGATPELQLNGWFPCGLSRVPSTTNATYAAAVAAATPFECAKVVMPLCHDGVCKSEKTIDVFVRRLLASSAAAATGDPKASSKPSKTAAKALWLLEGGPGASSASLERIMLSMAQYTQVSVDFYTLDHRGTGRSNFLECQAAQAFGAGGPNGVEPAYSEYPNCIRDLLFQMDNHTEAYSVTSAAKDVAFLVDRLYPSSVETFVWGMSYGTYFTERVMHLAPKTIKGYVLDGVIAEDDPTFANWNSINLPTDARFAKLCEDDVFCRAKLAPEIKQHGSVANAWRAVYATLDAAKPSENKCVKLAQKTFGRDVKPSVGLKDYLDGLTGNIAKRLLIPAILHRFYTCTDADVAFLEMLVSSSALHARSTPLKTSLTKVSLRTRMARASEAFDPVTRSSPFLAMLIKASEMWTFPSPSWSDEQRVFDKGLFSSDLSYDYITNCIATADPKNPACSVLTSNTSSKVTPTVLAKLLDHPPFVYKRDAYWGKFATIPAHAGVLMINGKLDFMTPSEWGAHEFANLNGNRNKLMVDFDNGVHCTGSMPTTFGDTTDCGFRIAASFVLQSGVTEKVDTSCVKKLPKLNFADVKAIQSVLPQVRDADALYGTKASAPSPSPSPKSANRNGFRVKVHYHNHHEEAALGRRHG